MDRSARVCKGGTSTEAEHGLLIGSARYHNEGIDGLENRPKSGRPSKLSEEVAVKVRKKLKERKQGWTTQQVNEIIVKEGNVHYHQIYIYTLLHKWGFKQKSTKKRYMLILHHMERKSSSKKSTENTRSFT